MFADDTVVSYAGKSTEEIESVLNSEPEIYIFRYFIKNDLIVNLRKVKTEALLEAGNYRVWIHSETRT